MEQLDRDVLTQIDGLLQDYAVCLSRIQTCRTHIRAKRWKNDIGRILLTWFPELEPLFDLFSDFRCDGNRILGNLLRDIKEENTTQERKQLVHFNDSPAFAAMMEDCQRDTRRYQETIASRCRALLEGIVKPVTAVRYVVALGRRSLLWELLLDALEPNLLEAPYAE